MLLIYIYIIPLGCFDWHHTYFDITLILLLMHVTLNIFLQKCCFDIRLYCTDFIQILYRPLILYLKQKGCQCKLFSFFVSTNSQPNFQGFFSLQVFFLLDQCWSYFWMHPSALYPRASFSYLSWFLCHLEEKPWEQCGSLFPDLLSLGLQHASVCLEISLTALLSILQRLAVLHFLLILLLCYVSWVYICITLVFTILWSW